MPTRDRWILFLLVMGPLICWLPLLGLDQLQPRRPQPQIPTHSPPDRSASARSPAPGQAPKSSPLSPLPPRQAKARTDPRLKQGPSRPRPPSVPAPTRVAGSAHDRAATGPAAKRHPAKGLAPKGHPSKREAAKRQAGKRLAAKAQSSKRQAAKGHPVASMRDPIASRQRDPIASRQRRRQSLRRQSLRRQRSAPAPLPPAILSTIKPQEPSGAMLLGNLDLSSLDEKQTLPAARLERNRQIASPDPLSVVPKAHKPAFLATIQAGERVIPAEIVRLPASHLKTVEQVPLLLRPGGRAQGPASLGSLASRQLVDGWLARQPAVASGSVRPVLLKLEPLPASRSHGAARPGAKPRPSHSASQLGNPKKSAPRKTMRARARRHGAASKASQRSRQPKTAPALRLTASPSSLP